jgi:protein-tyrosine-phosphatase
VNVLFVCGGNTCRSPLAAAIAARAVAERGSAIEVASAGVRARPGAPASTEAQAVAAEHGLDLSAHHSRRLDAELVAWADLLVAMTSEQAAAAAELGMTELVMIGPVADPFGHGVEAYRATYDLLLPRVEALVAGTSAGAGS